MFSRTRLFIGFIGLGLMFLFGCGGAEEAATAEPAPVETVQTDAAEIELTEESQAAVVPTDTPTPTVVPTRTPTPFPAEISLPNTDGSAFYLDEGELVFDQVSSPQDGWVVIWPDSNGTLSADKALGFIEIDEGMQTDVAVEIDLTEIRGRSIQVALHGGRLADADFEADADNLLLIQTMAVDTPASRPMIETSATFVSEDGFLQIDKVQSDGPGWVAVFNAGDDTLLGFAPVEAGVSTGVLVPVRWQVATTEIEVHLLQDLGNVAEFEADVDLPAEFQGELVMVEVSVGLPAEIVVFDQPMPDFVVVDRVTTPFDGYLVAFGDADEDGFPETILGSTQVTAGAAEDVEIDINQGAATAQILLSLFTDSNQSGEFDFPDDEPVRIGGDAPRQLLVPVRSDIEGLLFVESDPTADSLHINLVATPVDSWLVVEILAEDESESAEILPLAAQLRLAPGLHHSLDIPLEAVELGDRIRVKLYVNNPDEELFDPERNDFPLQADERLLFVELEIQ